MFLSWSNQFFPLTRRHLQQYIASKAIEDIVGVGCHGERCLLAQAWKALHPTETIFVNSNGVALDGMGYWLRPWQHAHISRIDHAFPGQAFTRAQYEALMGGPVEYKKKARRSPHMPPGESHR